MDIHLGSNVFCHIYLEFTRKGQAPYSHCLSCLGPKCLTSQNPLSRDSFICPMGLDSSLEITNPAIFKIDSAFCENEKGLSLGLASMKGESAQRKMGNSRYILYF